MKRRKLQLRHEIVRHIDVAQLTRVVGGAQVTALESGAEACTSHVDSATSVAVKI